MPGYFLHGLCCNQRGLGMLYETVRPGDYRIYRDTQPILGFPELPVSTMFEVGGVSMPIDEVVGIGLIERQHHTVWVVSEVLAVLSSGISHGLSARGHTDSQLKG